MLRYVTHVACGHTRGYRADSRLQLPRIYGWFTFTLRLRCCPFVTLPFFAVGSFDFAVVTVVGLLRLLFEPVYVCGLRLHYGWLHFRWVTFTTHVTFGCALPTPFDYGFYVVVGRLLQFDYYRFVVTGPRYIFPLICCGSHLVVSYRLICCRSVTFDYLCWLPIRYLTFVTLRLFTFIVVVTVYPLLFPFTLLIQTFGYRLLHCCYCDYIWLQLDGDFAYIYVTLHDCG